MPGRAALPDEAIVAVLREVGEARLDDLAEHLGYHRTTVQRRADGLVARGVIGCHDGRRGIGGTEREYFVGDNAPEQASADGAD